MSDLELMVRGAAVGGFASLGLCLLRVEARKLRLSGVLFCLSAAAHVITQETASRLAVGPAFPLVWTLSVMGTAMFWAFATDLFSDAERPFWRRFWPCLPLLAIGLVARLAPISGRDQLWIVHSLVGVVLMAHALAVIAGGWRDDLVESRRRLRGPVLGAGAVYGVLNGLVQIGEILWGEAPILGPLAAWTLFALSTASIFVFLKTDPALLDRPARPSPDRDLSPQDRLALSRLKQAMDVDEAWRREALTMFDLARIVEAPEHRLRRLINDSLGYRNFSAFLNERRIAAAKAALVRMGLPVSTVAYEVGFASLGPFNRAFKAQTGMTPTQWREQALPSP